MRTLEPVIARQADVDWEDLADPANVDPSAIRWKLLISRERSPSGGLVTGAAKIEPGAKLSRHHHEPEETYYVLSGCGDLEIEDIVYHRDA